jgi:hypothetical protein
MRDSKLHTTITNIIRHGEQKGILHDETAQTILELFYDREVPQDYLDPCDCADYTMNLRDSVFQHNPMCPLHDPRIELALLAKHRWSEIKRRIQDYR